MKAQINILNKELEITKEKLHTVEQAWEQMNKLGKYGSYIATLKIKWYVLFNILKYFKLMYLKTTTKKVKTVLYLSLTVFFFLVIFICLFVSFYLSV